MDPGYLEARKNLILTAMDLGDRERARVQLNRLTILVPDDPFISGMEDVLYVDH